jgi:site-specific DNA recombinase
VKRDKFKRVQDVLSGRNVNKCRPHRLSLLFPFRGLLTCSQCGCNLTAERHKGKYDYYRCSFSHGRHQAEWIKSEQLSAALSCVVDGIRIPEQVVRQIVESIRTDFSQIEAKRREQISRLNQRLSALRTRMSKSYDDKLEGKIDEQFWVVRHSEWMDEQHQLEAEMEKLQQPTAAADPALSAQKILELAQNAHSIYLAGNDTERAQLLRILILNCQTDGVTLTPTYRKPFDLICQRGKNEEWRRGRDSNPRYGFVALSLDLSVSCR